MLHIPKYQLNLTAMVACVRGLLQRHAQPTRLEQATAGANPIHVASQRYVLAVIVHLQALNVLIHFLTSTTPGIQNAAPMMTKVTTRPQAIRLPFVSQPQ